MTPLKSLAAAFPVQRKPAAPHADQAPLRAEVFGVNRLEEHARAWALQERVTQLSRRGHHLLRRLHQNRAALFAAQKRFAALAREGQIISPSAEWLLDNFYIVQEQLREIAQDLTHRYYHELPKTMEGRYAGYPRVYGLALELIAHTDSHLDTEVITRFAQAYQSVTPLTSGELWAVAIMLRLGLVENLRRLIDQSLMSAQKREAADAWAAQFFKTPKRTVSEVFIVVGELAQSQERLDTVFVVHLLQRLRDADPAIAPVIHWLEQRLHEEGTSVEDIVRAEHLRRAANRVSVGNVITSMRTLSIVDWPTFFESTNLAERRLRADPTGVYAAMDFATRDQYRHVVEDISRHSPADEQTVARKAIELAGRQANTNGGLRSALKHVGYYLIAEGRAQLESAVGYQPTLHERAHRWLFNHPTLFYLGLIGGLTLVLMAVVLAYAVNAGAASALLVLVALLTLIPASVIAVSAVNWTISVATDPQPLPKLEFKDELPDECRTMVVVPALISSFAGVQKLIDDLEIRYLANRDAHLHFALLGDFADASEQHRPEDTALLDALIHQIEELNARYDNGAQQADRPSRARSDRFYLFHRQRTWNAGEQKWIGWERKRGKLIEFNRLLRGATNTNYTVQVGDLSILPQIQFVITLDADTELPMNSAKRLIGTLAHPLNRPVLDPATRRVVAGYAIIQPRTAVSALAAAESRFAEIFAGDTGLDPYSTAASDVYQDLFGEGIYVGKAIYDVDALKAALDGRFPQNLLLSHDLLESTFARAGLATDIQLLEDYPSGYDAYTQREHRWIRGDWQITDWLFPRVRDASGRRVRNPLPIIERWKLLDNLRRSLLPLSIILLLSAAWTLLPGSPLVWTLVALLPLIFPHFISFAAGIGVHPKGEPWRAYLSVLRHEAWLNLVRAFLQITFSLHQAVLSVDAIARVSVRRTLTHRHLLEWNSAADVERGQARTLADYGLRMWPSPLFAGVLLILLFIVQPAALLVALPLLALWGAAPFLAYTVSQPRKTHEAPLPAEAYNELRLVARKIWRFYEAFAGAYDHYLPPDNYQADPIPIVAHRTSPTNIGFLLLSTVAAYDFGYIGAVEVAERLERTFTTLDQLERYRGHFYNWYDTATLHPLLPQYVSTVDSGNLAASLIALKQACLAMGDAHLLTPALLRGLDDTLAALQESLKQMAVASPEVAPLCEQMDATCQHTRSRLQDVPHSISSWLKLLDQLDQACAMLGAPKHALGQELGIPAIADIRYWCDSLERHAQAHRVAIELLLPWAVQSKAPVLSGVEGCSVERDDNLSTLYASLSTALDLVPSLSDLAAGCAVSADLGVFEKELEQAAISDDERAKMQVWLSETKTMLQRSQQEASRLLTRYHTLAQRAAELVQETDFKFLFDRQREIFSIGYNVATHRLDNSYYDLLASECRLTSFVAIALGQAPARHWFKLGRPLTHTADTIALLSWGGTMFEYLMPPLLMRTYQHTLLNQTIRAALRRQIQYGKEHHVPWGISESGFNALDYQNNYQYRLFGVPDLGLKREQSDNLVVAPYATFIALPFAPKAAWDNLKALAHAGGSDGYGYYEAIDYTPARRPKNNRAGVVHSFMAHHQGMSLVALDNFLHDNIMQQRFHNEPMISATELLLQERLPRHAPIIEPHPDEDYQPRAVETPASAARPFRTADTRTPRTHILSNGMYTVMLTNAGSGYSAYKNVEVTRWRADITRDDWGQFIYIKDMQSNTLWSTAYQPTARQPDHYEVNFTFDKIEFLRRDAGIETRTEIAVSPEDNVEVRRVYLTNNTRQTRELQLTSYAEVVLDAHSADAVHPAFSKLFVESEFLPSRSVLLFKRRARAPGGAPTRALHFLNVEGHASQALTYETDRARFLGRGQTPRDADALNGTLSNTVGAVLDPIMSLRCQVSLEPGAQVVVSFITGVPDSREHALMLADEYCDPRAVERVFDLVSAHGQVELRHLGITSDDAHLFQRLASRVLYPDLALRAPADVLARNVKGQPGLFAYGISGDHPVVLVKVDDQAELGLVRQTLLAHEFWRLNNFTADLVILNGHATTYSDELQNAIQAMIDTSLSRPWLDKPGGVFLRRSDHISAEDKVLLETVAHVVLSGELGTLADQLERSARLTSGEKLVLSDKWQVTGDRGQGTGDKTQTGATSPVTRDPPALPALREVTHGRDVTHESLFFNGFGGFDPAQREYVIGLDKGQWTPTPWINVLANANFGCLVSESALGYSWAVNSQLNRLTPWSNDPVSDPPGEALYLVDEDSGEMWTPTPLPIRADEPYRIQHGGGYTRFTHRSHGLAQELLVFVPTADPIKIMRLKVRNESSQARTLSVTSYTEWVLGVTREQSQYFVVSELDEELDALYARNTYNSDFNQRVAFVAANEPLHGVTADRSEFIGRNGSMRQPAGLRRTHLSRQVGAGLDPCAAAQVKIELQADQEKEIVFLIGQGQDKDQARALIQKYRARAQVQTAFDALKAHWEQLLGAVQVKTPDAAMDLLLNQWLLYQVLACRVWGRTANYQSGGAYGYRDQLQDVMALVFAAPQLAREQILRAAAHQFLEGDALHWWHPPGDAGVRTRCSDDYLWLPYVAAHYVATTGDVGILDEPVSFLKAPPLEPDQHEAYLHPADSGQQGTLFEHCTRALDHALALFGEHGLPLMGSGDWNDGMNRVGVGGKGESVWVGWFLYSNLVAFAKLADPRGPQDLAGRYNQRAEQLKQALDEHGWDGEWYRRAYFDDGTPLGSAQNDECQIDSIAQSWAIISQAGTPERTQQAMQSVEKYLVDEKDQLIRLLTPPFDQGQLEPGYIKGYVPGIRENGGQYTHAALWVVLAYIMHGNGDRAAQLFQLLNPINHARTTADVARYQVEPYVIAADVYAHPQHVGRGGWTWYTGSAGWMYLVGVEGILGLKRRGHALVIDPCIPRDWKQYQMSYRHGATTYEITVENPNGVSRGVARVEVDGAEQASREIALVDDGQTHRVRVVLGEK